MLDAPIDSIDCQLAGLSNLGKRVIGVLLQDLQRHRIADGSQRLSGLPNQCVCCSACLVAPPGIRYVARAVRAFLVPHGAPCCSLGGSPEPTSGMGWHRGPSSGPEQTQSRGAAVHSSHSCLQQMVSMFVCCTSDTWIVMSVMAWCAHTTNERFDGEVATEVGESEDRAEARADRLRRIGQQCPDAAYHVFGRRLSVACMVLRMRCHCYCCWLLVVGCWLLSFGYVQCASGWCGEQGMRENRPRVACVVL
jgi:hypothetical protein